MCQFDLLVDNHVNTLHGGVMHQWDDLVDVDVDALHGKRISY